LQHIPLSGETSVTPNRVGEVRPFLFSCQRPRGRFRTRADLEFEVVALGHQLNVLRRLWLPKTPKAPKSLEFRDSPP
jgi:hypothetical protein